MTETDNPAGDGIADFGARTGPIDITVTAAGSNWVEAFYREVDKLDIDVLAGCISDDIDVRFGNNPPIQGRAAALETFKGFWGTISGMSHKREAVVINGTQGVLMATVTYARLDGSTVALPVASHVQQDAQGKINRLWVYIDLAPLFSQGN